MVRSGKDSYKKVWGELKGNERGQEEYVKSLSESEYRDLMEHSGKRVDTALERERRQKGRKTAEAYSQRR